MNFTDTFLYKLTPFVEDMSVLYPKDLLITEDYTEALRTDKLLSYELVDDVKGYCQAHDIDLNLYRYVYTAECTKDFFNPNTLDWMVIFNNHPLKYYEENDKLTLNQIWQASLDNIVIKDEDTVTYAEGFEPIIPPDHVWMEQLIGNDDKVAKKRLKKLKAWLYHYPNTKRYGFKSYNRAGYDDDETNEKVFKEDPEFMDKTTDTNNSIWPAYRFAIIHHHFYVFCIQSKGLVHSDIKNLLVVKPNNAINKRLELDYVSYTPTDDIVGDHLVMPYKLTSDDKTHLTTIKYGNNISDISSNIYLDIRSKFIKLNRSNLEDVIRETILTYFPNARDKILEPDEKGTYHLKYDAGIDFLRNIHIRTIIKAGDEYQKDDDIKNQIKLWMLDTLSTGTHEGDIFILYDGMSIEEWIEDYVNRQMVTPDTYYMHDWKMFNKYTKGKCIDKIPSLQTAVDLPDNYTTMESQELADYLRDRDYDLFMAYYKINHKINIRIRLDDKDKVDLVKETIDGDVINDLPYIFDEDKHYFKFSISNFRRNPFDVYICDKLYTGPKIISRELYYDILYIPVLQLYRWMKTMGFDGFDYPYPEDYAHLFDNEKEGIEEQSVDKNLSTIKASWNLMFIERLAIDDNFRDLKETTKEPFNTAKEQYTSNLPLWTSIQNGIDSIKISDVYTYDNRVESKYQFIPTDVINWMKEETNVDETDNVSGVFSSTNADKVINKIARGSFNPLIDYNGNKAYAELYLTNNYALNSLIMPSFTTLGKYTMGHFIKNGISKNTIYIPQNIRNNHYPDTFTPIYNPVFNSFNMWYIPTFVSDRKEDMMYNVSDNNKPATTAAIKKELSIFDKYGLADYSNVRTSRSKKNAYNGLTVHDQIMTLAKNFRFNYFKLQKDGKYLNTANNLTNLLNSNYKIKVYLTHTGRYGALCLNDLMSKDNVWNYLESLPSRVYTIDECKNITLNSLISDFNNYLWKPPKTKPEPTSEFILPEDSRNWYCVRGGKAGHFDAIWDHSSSNRAHYASDDLVNKYYCDDQTGTSHWNLARPWEEYTKETMTKPKPTVTTGDGSSVDGSSVDTDDDLAYYDINNFIAVIQPDGYILPDDPVNPIIYVPGDTPGHIEKKPVPYNPFELVPGTIHTIYPHTDYNYAPDDTVWKNWFSETPKLISPQNIEDNQLPLPENMPKKKEEEVVDTGTTVNVDIYKDRHMVRTEVFIITEQELNNDLAYLKSFIYNNDRIETNLKNKLTLDKVLYNRLLTKFNPKDSKEKIYDMLNTYRDGGYTIINAPEAQAPNGWAKINSEAIEYILGRFDNRSDYYRGAVRNGLESIKTDKNHTISATVYFLSNITTPYNTLEYDTKNPNNLMNFLYGTANDDTSSLKLIDKLPNYYSVHIKDVRKWFSVSSNTMDTMLHAFANMFTYYDKVAKPDDVYGLYFDSNDYHYGVPTPERQYKPQYAKEKYLEEYGDKHLILPNTQWMLMVLKSEHKKEGRE